MCIGVYQVRELSIFPIIIAAIDYYATQGDCVAVNILGRRMDDHIRAMLKGLYQERCGKGVVNKERNVKFLGELREFFEIQNAKRRVSDGFAKENFGIGAESLSNFCNGCLRINKGGFYAKF